MDLYSFLSAVIHLMRFLHQHPLENAMNTHRKLELGVGYCGLLYTYIYIYNAFLTLMIYQGEPVLMIMIALVN